MPKKVSKATPSHSKTARTTTLPTLPSKLPSKRSRIPSKDVTMDVEAQPDNRNDSGDGDGITIDSLTRDVVTMDVVTVFERTGAEIKTQALSLLKKAEVEISVNVRDEASQADAAYFCSRVLAPAIKEAHAKLDPYVASLKAAYDHARNQRDEYLEPYERADALVRNALNDYYNRRKIAQREEENRARREQIEREAAAIVQKQQEIERLEMELESLPANASIGDIDRLYNRLEELRGRSIVVAPVVRTSRRITTAPGMAQQENWCGEVTDKMAVIRQVLEGELPESLVEIRQPELNKLAKIWKAAKEFEGLRFYDESFVRRTGR